MTDLIERLGNTKGIEGESIQWNKGIGMLKIRSIEDEAGGGIHNRHLEMVYNNFI